MVLVLPSDGEDPMDATTIELYEIYATHRRAKFAVLLAIKDHNVHFVT